MTRVFSWRGQLLVEVEGGFRNNSTDEVFFNIDVAIANIDREMGGEPEYDLLCVIHNCLYWQCECGNNLLPQTQPGEIVEWLSHNFGEFVKNHRMQTLDECLEPVCDAPRKLQVSNCEPLYTGSWKVNGLFIELGNGMKFKVKIEVTE